MPATPNTVSLDQARDWARRLHKSTPTIGKLSDAQKSVAVMLGHADWNALSRFYTNTLTPASKEGVNSLDEQLQQANALYPGLNAKQIEVLAMELDEMEGSASDIIDRAGELEREEGAFLSDAFEQALQEASYTVLPPPGHLFVRVINEAGKRVFTLLPSRPQLRHDSQNPGPSIPPLGRFGHDHDPALDFLMEVKALKDYFLNPRENEVPQSHLQQRVMRANSFKVGAVPEAVEAKRELSVAWLAYCNQLSRPQSKSKKAPK